MNLKELEKEVDGALKSSSRWQELHEEIVQNHRNAKSSEEREILLGLHKTLLDKVELKLPKQIDMEKFKNARMQEYNAMLLYECTIGENLCVETLYDLTQRELEAGRMLPTHEFIETAIQATASNHYSRDQLLRQKEKIQKIEKNSAFNKISRLFKT